MQVLRTLILAPKLQHPQQADGVVAAAQVAEWQREVMEGFEAEWAAAQAGVYRESAKQFLSSSWQGDALAVRCFA